MASPSSFSNPKDLKFIFTLGIGRSQLQSNGQKYNTVTLQGLRAAVYIENAGGAMMGTLRAQIFGVNESDMNTLTSTMWDFLTITSPNTVQVFAVDGAQETLIYNGIILNCWGIFTQMPETYLMVEAQVAYEQQVQSASPTSISANTTVDTVMQNIAKKMGFQFENKGVSGATVNQVVSSSSTYLVGSLIEQARSMMQAYHFWMYIDSTNPNTLAIVPYGVARNVIAPLISAETGLIGYPMFSSIGVNFETLFNPGIVFGGPVQVKSSILKANQTWTVVSMAHNLSSQAPGGPWETIVNAVSQKILSGVQQ